MKTAIVCCLHGDEPYGLNVVKTLPLPFFIGNEFALERKIRFIESDMNRCFPGNSNGNYEERRANILIKKLKKYDYVIDLHSSSNYCPLFGIITNPNKEKIDLARKLGLKKLVIMPKSFANGGSLIDFVKCGISLEIGPHERKENIKEVLNVITNFLNGNKGGHKLEIFEVFDIIKKDYSKVLINNFDEIRKGQAISSNCKKRQISKFYFTAVLVNEKSYENILCLVCRRINASAVHKA